jgi:hypothetical protein
LREVSHDKRPSRIMISASCLAIVTIPAYSKGLTVR